MVAHEGIRGRGALAALSALVIAVVVLVALAQRAEARAASATDDARIAAGQGQLAPGADDRGAAVGTRSVGATAVGACDDTEGGCSNVASWKSAINPNTGKHDIRVQDYKGSYASFDFKGTSIKWVTVKAPSGGKATVFLDGKKVKVFDAYASAVKLDQTGYFKKNLPNKKHVLEIITTDSNPASAGYKAYVDEFRVGRKVYQENSYKITYGDFGIGNGGVWKGFADSRAYGGSYRASKSIDVPVTFYYPTGSDIGIKTAVGSSLGEMYVLVSEYDPGTNLPTPVGYTIIDTQAASLAFVTKPVTSYTDANGSVHELDPNKQYAIEVFSNSGDLVVVDGWTGDLP